MILLAVGWYVEGLLAERGHLVDHVTVWSWAQRYAPEIQGRLRLRLRPTNDSWWVDETYIRVKGQWVYLYRDVNSTGAAIDFLLSAKRDAAVAERFLAQALGGENHPRFLALALFFWKGELHAGNRRQGRRNHGRKQRTTKLYDRTKDEIH